VPRAAPTHTSVQWWEINPATGSVAQFGRIDDPSGQTFYAYPSIAVNDHHDVLIGYSRFSSSQYASANYSFRSGNDPLNTLQADTVLKAGEAPYFKQYAGTENRWGDYSATVVDPNDNDMWTIQEYAATPGGGFDRWGTWWGQVSPGALPPTWPGGSTINAADLRMSSLTLSWSAAEDDRAVTGYRIRQDGAVVASSLTQTTTGITGLTAATQYTFQVDAGDDRGQWTSGPSVTVTTPQDMPPTWPGGSTIDAAEVLESSLTLSWSTAQDDFAVAGYRVFQDGVLLTTTTGNSTSVTGLMPAADYTFQVHAGDAIGQWTGGPSVTVTMAQDFIDTDGSVFEIDAAWLSGRGVTRGCNPPVNDLFCPDDNVTRGQMAAFLVRALGYSDNGGGDLFVDDDGSIFEDAIDKLGTAGVTRGCNPPVNDLFCPDAFVSRGQMAAFLHRAGI
jgi:chitodextrinase